MEPELLDDGPAPELPPMLEPTLPAREVTVVASPETWRVAIAVLMEAPVAGRIVAPLTGLIEGAMRAAGHSL